MVPKLVLRPPDMERKLPAASTSWLMDLLMRGRVTLKASMLEFCRKRTTCWTASQSERSEKSVRL